MHSIASGLVRVICAASLLGCGSSPSQPAQPESPPRPAVSSDWREVVPAGPQAVIGMNIIRLGRSPLVEALVETIVAQDAQTAQTLDVLRAVSGECGMELRRDFHSAVVATYYGERAPAMVAVIKGKFDEARIVDCATRMAQRMNSALATTEISGYQVHSNPGAPEAGVVCVPGPNLMIIASDQATMETTLAARTPRFGSERTELSAVLFELPQDRSIWGAGVVPADSDIAGYVQQATSGVLSRPGLTVYGHAEIQDGIQGEGGLVLASAQDASFLLEWANAQISMMRTLLLTQGLGSLLDGLSLATRGERLTVSLSLSAAQIHKIMQIVQ
jgi:hypothetical protein